MIYKRNSVKFLNLWDTFHDNRKLFRRVGIHFSEAGRRLFGNLINQNLYSHFRKPQKLLIEHWNQ